MVYPDPSKGAVLTYGDKAGKDKDATGGLRGREAMENPGRSGSCQDLRLRLEDTDRGKRRLSKHTGREEARGRKDKR